MSKDSRRGINLIFSRITVLTSSHSKWFDSTGENVLNMVPCRAVIGRPQKGEPVRHFRLHSADHRGLADGLPTVRSETRCNTPSHWLSGAARTNRKADWIGHVAEQE
jgi:hypothetical protein